MATNGQQSSSDKTYRDSINFLEDARAELGAIKAEIETQQQVLGGSYSGDDGVEYGRQLVNWLNIMEAIRDTCRSMENVLGENWQASNVAQQANLHLVADASRQFGAIDGSISGSTFNTLTR